MSALRPSRTLSQAKALSETGHEAWAAGPAKFGVGPRWGQVISLRIPAPGALGQTEISLISMRLATSAYRSTAWPGAEIEITRA